MSQRTNYEIVLRGHPSPRLLRPLVDDFTVDTSGDDTTCLVGAVGDPAHLHGIVAHLTSVNLEIVSIAPTPTPLSDSNKPTSTPTSPPRPDKQGHTMTITSDETTAARSAEAGVEPQMHAITQDRYGTAERLALETVSRPTPEHDEVLIEVAAAGVDRGTCHLMTGTPYLIRIAGYGLTGPKHRIPGLDVAGRVAAVGASVTRFAVGDEVFGIANGSLAEYAVAKEDKLALKPARLSFEQAAVSAVSGIAALQALTDVGDVQPDQRVLIVGASGGVGSFAVQLAKAFGADVTAVASTRNLDFMRMLGADHVVDYTTQDFTELDGRYDLIIDIGGRNSIRRLRSVLTHTGTLVIVGGEDGNRITGGIGRQLGAVMLSPFLNQRLTTFVSTEHHSFMERLAAYMATGAVTPAVHARFALDDAATAIAQLDGGKATGKTAIVITNDAGARQ